MKKIFLSLIILTSFYTQSYALNESKNTNDLYLSDINQILKTLKQSKFNIKKGEFEKQIDFENRIKNIDNYMIDKNKTFSDLLCFNLNDSEKLNFDFKYNSEKEEIDLNISVMRSLENTFSEKIIPIDLNKKITENKSYISQNAYGAKVKVNKTKLETFGLDIYNPEELTKQNKDEFTYSYDFKLNLKENKNIKDAKNLKDSIDKKQLNLLFIGKLNKNKLTRNLWYYNTPTFSDPFELEIIGINLGFFLEEVILYNKKNKTIIHRFQKI